MTSSRRPTSLHIERLVLEGLPLTASQGARMRESMEQELSRLVASAGASPLPGGRGRQVLQRGPQVVWDTSRPHHLGRALAHSVYASLHDRVTPPSTPRGQK